MMTSLDRLRDIQESRAHKQSKENSGQDLHLLSDAIRRLEESNANMAAGAMPSNSGAPTTSDKISRSHPLSGTPAASDVSAATKQPRAIVSKSLVQTVLHSRSSSSVPSPMALPPTMMRPAVIYPFSAPVPPVADPVTSKRGSTPLTAAPGMGRAPETPEAQTKTNISFSTIGFGCDSGPVIGGTPADFDATEAAVRAVRDALDRSMFQLDRQKSQGDSWQVQVKLGVPPSAADGGPMPLDFKKVADVLPKDIKVLPIKAVVGGLAIREETTTKSENEPTLCSVVCCLTLQCVPCSTSCGIVASQRSAATAPMMESVERPSSMDVLARISAEVRKRDIRAASCCVLLQAPPTAGATTSVVHGFHSTYGHGQQKQSLPPAVCADATARLGSPTLTSDVNPKAYHDYSKEQPTSEDSALLFSKLYGAAFPVKLHQVLEQVEADGLDHIFGWLPHGRCFKIKDSDAFANTILPGYFGMNKKSSFLRQLNLYGFNRLSVGPDKGGYYNELFLRGMRFLCRRMSRVKVNGNGIRQAPQPQSEPRFYQMPSVPLSKTPQAPAPRALVSSSSSNSSMSSSDSSVVSNEDDASSDESNIAVPQQSHQPSPTAPSTIHCSHATNVSFPMKLHTMLDTLERSDTGQEIIAWLPHGRAFTVLNPDGFVRELMPKFFRQTKFSSFQRQLHMYSFQRISTGRDKGAYFHKKFLRGEPELSQQMVRTRINGKGCRRPSDPSTEPDLWKMRPMPRLNSA